MAKTLRFLKQLPQNYALSGIKRRMPFETQYQTGQRTLRNMMQAAPPIAPEPQVAPAPVAPPVEQESRPLNFGIPTNESGLLSAAPPSDRTATSFEDILAYDLGDTLATGSALRGGTSGLKSGAGLVAMGAPQGVIPELATRSALASMFSLPASAQTVSKGLYSSLFDIPDLVTGAKETFSPEAHEEVVNAFNTRSDPNTMSIEAQIMNNMRGDFRNRGPIDALVDVVRGRENPAVNALSIARSPELHNLLPQKIPGKATPTPTEGPGLITPGHEEFTPGLLESYPISEPPDIAPLDPGGESESGDGTVLCTVLHNKGIMPDSIYEKDVKFGESLPQEVRDGYHAWAVPLAYKMEQSELLTKIITPPVMAWARHMAGDKNLFGYIAETIGIPICRFIGKLTNRNMVEA